MSHHNPDWPLFPVQLPHTRSIEEIETDIQRIRSLREARYSIGQITWATGIDSDRVRAFLHL